ncbi:MAG: glycoside hydrolase family 16 protein [Mycobacteriales bacterium]
MRTPTHLTRRLLGAVSTLAVGSASMLLHPHQQPRAYAPTPVTAAQGLGPAVPERRAVPHVASRGRLRRAPGGAMPVGNLRGWKQVLAEDFTRTTLPRGWGKYAGQPGGNPHGWWDPSHVAVRGKDLHLVGDWQHGRFVTGGLMAAYTAAYGKYEVRLKVSRAPGVAYALLLWPADGDWPGGGEIDFAEDGGGSRSATTATLHYGAANHQLQRHVRTDVTRFQTVGVEWSPGKLVYTLNGKPWATVISSRVPSRPMRLALQLEAGRGTSWSPAPTRATPRTVDLVVDWVVGYRRV